MLHGCVCTPFIRHMLTSTAVTFPIEDHLRTNEDGTAHDGVMEIK